MSIVLVGSTSGSITLQEPAVAGSNTISLPAATGTAVLTGVSGTVDINAAGSNNVTLSTNSTERVRVDSSGNVGIGTSSASEKLDVIGNIQVGDGGNTRGLYVGPDNFTGAFLYRSDGNCEISPRSGYSLLFAASPSGTERMRITSAGVVELTSGQLKFPATQSASSDANTLDDYEEGTWTPGISFGGGSTGITYSAQYGTYTKIGNTVTVQAYVQMSNKGSSSGVLRVTGLPFTNNSNSRAYNTTPVWINNTLSGLSGVVGCYVEPNLTTIYYERLSGGFFGNFNQINETMVSNSTDLMIAVTYRV